MKLSLGEQQYKVPADTVLAESEIYRLITIGDCVAIPVHSSKEPFEGYLLFGEIHFVADAIAHTDKGAIGRSLDRFCQEILFLGSKIPEKWLTIPYDIRKIQFFQRGQEILDYITFNELKVDCHMNKQTLQEAQHIIFAPYTLNYKDATWLIGNSERNLVLIDKMEVFVRKDDDNLVYVSGPNGKVEIVTKGHILTVGGKGGVSFTQNGEEVTLGNLLEGVFSNLGKAFDRY